MMQWFWYWLGCKLQRRMPRRVIKAERAADTLIADVDPDWARELGILPPLPNVVLLQGEFQQRMATMFQNQQMQTQARIPYMLQIQQAQMRQNAHRSDLLGGLGGIIGGPLGGAMGSAT